MPTRNAEAEWKGNLAEGSGRLKVGSGASDGPYSFKSRFEEGQSVTNPQASACPNFRRSQTSSAACTVAQIAKIQRTALWEIRLISYCRQPFRRSTTIGISTDSL